MIRPHLALLAAAVALPLGIGAVVGTTPAAADHHNEGADTAAGDLLAVLAADEQFSTLAGALESSGVADTLREGGPYTLFAPNNAAFEKVDPADLEALLNNQKKLEKILLGHVIEGEVMSGDLEEEQKVETLAGKPIRIVNKNGKIKVNGRLVSTADLAADNGVIHILDDVILPRPKAEGGNADQGDGEGGNAGRGEGKGKGKGKGKKKGNGGDGGDDDDE